MPIRYSIKSLGRKGVSTARYLQEFNTTADVLRQAASELLTEGKLNAVQAKNVRNLLRRKSMGGSGG